MKQPDNWQTPPGPGEWQGEQESMMPGMAPRGYGEGYYSGSYRPRKKWLAALFSVFVPGTGHMYLGLMSKGIMIMLMLALNICGIVYFAIENEYDSNVLIIVLLSLLVPILYFYNIFSVLQCAEMVNEQRAAGYRNLGSGPQFWNGFNPSKEDGEANQLPVTGIILLLVAGFLLFQYSRSDWSHNMPHSFGSVAGAIILIGIGALVWFWDRKGQSQKKV